MSKAELLVPHRKIVNHYKISEKKLIGISQFEINNRVLALVFFFTTFYLGTGSQNIQKEQLNSLDIMNLLPCSWVKTLWALRGTTVGHLKYSQLPIVFLWEIVSTQNSSPLLLGWDFVHFFLVAFKSYSGTFPFLLISHG